MSTLSSRKTVPKWVYHLRMLLLAIAGCGATKSADLDSPEPTTDTVNIGIVASKIEFGQIPADTRVTGFGVIRNATDHPFSISSIKTSCECVVVNCDQLRVPPGDFSLFRVEIGELQEGQRFRFVVTFEDAQRHASCETDITVSVVRPWQAKLIKVGEQ